MNLTALLTNRLCLLLKQSESLEQLLNLMPQGKIRFDKNGDNWRWRLIDPDHEPKMTTIRKTDVEYAQKMSEKRFLSNYYELLKAQIAAIDTFLKNYAEDFVAPGVGISSRLESYHYF